MKKLLTLFIALAVFHTAFAQTKTALPPFAVVELFTSEGCNTCPPADELLKKIQAEADKKKQPVYTIAYHVDYWNKLGWKDPYSKLQFTYLQQNYTSALNEKEMYTPYMIVNGQYAFNGSNQSKANEAIDKVLKTPAAYNISIKKDSVANDTLYVSYQSSAASVDASIKILLLESGLKSIATSGENKGKTFLHDNVCRAYQSKTLGSKTGQVKISLKNITLSKGVSVIAFVQQKGTFKIRGFCEGKL
jgi:hypothetical protein